MELQSSQLTQQMRAARALAGSLGRQISPAPPVPPIRPPPIRPPPLLTYPPR